METWQAALLGVVEGLTEYLPVSSTGHLLVVQRLLGLGGDEAGNAFAICIQAGAIAAVLGLYRARVAQMARGLVGRDAVGRRLLVAVAVAFVPAAALGLTFGDWIEARLFGPWPVIAAWLVGGLAILVVERFRRPRSGPGAELPALAARGALLIGLCQCLALWPGTSRSLVTILGGVLAGLSLPAAVEFSFLLGVATLFAATAYEALDSGAVMLASYGWPAILVGAAAAFLSAWLAVRWMVAWLSSHGMAVFGWYRIAIAGLAALVLV